MGITQRRRLRQVVREAFLGLLFLLPVAAQADWLVLQTGLRIETKGPWTVKGKQVVYTSTDKVLRSMRLSEIDLPASTRASAVEPASKPKLYQDMGEAPDIATVKPPPVEFNRLNAWISNPNRAAGERDGVGSDPAPLRGRPGARGHENPLGS